MAIICNKHNMLFIMTPRTACTAVGKLLCTDYEGKYIPSFDILDSNGNIRTQRKHSTLDELKHENLLTEDEARGLFKFAAVRNPFDSMVSLYIKKRDKYRPLLNDPNSWVNRSPKYARDMAYCANHSFDQWIRKVSMKRIAKRLLGAKPSLFYTYIKDMDMILRYENIQNDLNEAIRKSGNTTKAEIPVVNRTKEREKANYRSYYSSQSILLVKLAFSYDFKTFNYAF